MRCIEARELRRHLNLGSRLVLPALLATIRSKNLTFAVVLRRYCMKVFMFFTKHVSTWQAKLLADLFPSLVGFVFISVYVDPHVPKYRSPKNGHYHTLPHLLSVNKFMSVRKTLAPPSVNLRKHGYEKHTYVETRR